MIIKHCVHRISNVKWVLKSCTVQNLWPWTIDIEKSRASPVGYNFNEFRVCFQKRFYLVHKRSFSYNFDIFHPLTGRQFLFTQEIIWEGQNHVQNIPSSLIITCNHSHHRWLYSRTSRNRAPKHSKYQEFVTCCFTIIVKLNS